MRYDLAVDPDGEYVIRVDAPLYLVAAVLEHVDETVELGTAAG